MLKRHFYSLALALGILLSLDGPASGSVVLTLLPGSDISGPPGSLIGWGYSLTDNDSTNWFESTNLNADSFSNGTAISLFDFPILAPGGSVIEAFDPLNSIGLYEFQWDVSAPVPFTNSGNFVLSGQWFDGDPLNGGNFIADAPDISVPYSALTTSSAVPEPSTLLLLAGGLALTGVARWCRQWHSVVRNASTMLTPVH